MSKTEAFTDLADHIRDELEDIILNHSIDDEELCLIVAPENICATLQFLKSDKDCRFTQLISICGADYPSREKRFDIVYHMLSMTLNQRIRIKLHVGENELVPTATKIFSAAGWYERETWDLYGIYFDGHEDLRRLLTDYGFHGHPLRKDFPLTGYVELRYDEEQQRVVYEPVKLTQAYRSFDYLSPWEGMTDIQLPGDEKGTIPERGWKQSDKTVGGQK
ncbi:MAG: NADH-quinone oxidoreductase subunit C [Alphaproteobacteria bacterium]|nr:NADH-quinone oxidoreductase subunit C [Alphaproteobacteria bacterium]NCQ88111.1 NADH-quinone oxidoreductase subunit C [Alphaproteobacteria bacterium]NCT05382.1 NADH-quinone oxidoreductase subunit C [Alphaproteobacteria bacterium]